MSTMSRELLRGLFWIWLCCYLAGPLFETFDCWDAPQEEMGDIASSACGALIWAAAGLSVPIFVFQQFCKSLGCLAGFRVFVQRPVSFKSLCVIVAVPTRALDTSPLRL